MHKITLTASKNVFGESYEWTFMSARVHNVHHQHAHMILDGHASIKDVVVSQNKFASAVFVGHWCRELLFHTRIAV